MRKGTRVGNGDSPFGNRGVWLAVLARGKKREKRGTGREGYITAKKLTESAAESYPIQRDLAITRATRSAQL